MNVLGLIGFGENPGACLVRDGQLVAFAEEERFNRLKGSHGLFPSQAASWCLRSAGLGLDDVGRIAFAWDATQYPWRVGRRYARTLLRHGRGRGGGMARASDAPFLTAGQLLMHWHPRVVRKGITEGLAAAGFNGPLPPIEFVPHHLSHAYSAYMLAGFKRAGILTMDGSGEEVSTQLALGDGDKVSVIDSVPIPHSLGWFYAAITQYLGFLPSRDEGKVMGLAALGEGRSASNKWRDPLSRVLRVGARGYEVDPSYTYLGAHSFGDRFTDSLAELLTAVDREAVPVAYGEQTEIAGELRSKYLEARYVDIAWAAQDLLEEAAVALARRLVDEHGVEDLCLAGGVAQNCKMNGEILRRSGAKRLFVQPAANDSGAALGAALVVAQQMGDQVRTPLHHAYYGPQYSNDEIQAALENAKVSYGRLENPAAEAAKLLSEGRIIGWFQGAMEMGARALGARSILANPLSADMRDRVNAQVKFRESWRPFCPSLTKQAEDAYVENPGESSFMIVAYQATESCANDLSAIVHADGSTRPQTVTRDANPLFHEVLSEFAGSSGHPVVLNTSFNVRGEPIICAPAEALRCFYSTGIDALVIGDFLLTK